MPVEWRRRPAGHMPRYEEAPEDAPYESRTSLGPLAWPVALLLWFFLPAAVVGTGVNFAIGLIAHNVRRKAKTMRTDNPEGAPVEV